MADEPDERPWHAVNEHTPFQMHCEVKMANGRIFTEAFYGTVKQQGRRDDSIRGWFVATLRNPFTPLPQTPVYWRRRVKR